MVKILYYFIIFIYTVISGIFLLLAKSIFSFATKDDLEKIIGYSIDMLDLNSDNISFYSKQHNNKDK